MNKRLLEGFRKDLLDRRAVLLKEVAGAEADLLAIAEERESEYVERAQEEGVARLLARLDERGQHEIDEIDAALSRLDDGDYGMCADCDRDIPIQRLRALPFARLCIECADEREKGGGAADVEENEAPRHGEVSADLALLRDQEVEDAVRERVRSDDRIDDRELRIVCRHGVAHIDGVLASASEHQILRRIIQDDLGMQEIVDRVQIKEIRDRAPVEIGDEMGEELRSLANDDVDDVDDGVRRGEDDTEYNPPDRPTPEEE